MILIISYILVFKWDSPDPETNGALNPGKVGGLNFGGRAWLLNAQLCHVINIVKSEGSSVQVIDKNR